MDDDRPESDDSVITAVEAAVLAFESDHPGHDRLKQQLIRAELELSVASYYQMLSQLIDRPAAWRIAPTCLAALRRARQRRRLTDQQM
ncbi:MAG: DUF3263 domain-containing protein [Propionibacteriaceae bacterium]|jgi:hypothetical protein|nr:DUF3263 domain-containing protein [Propionibacteriaceae bacterium]